MRKKTIGIVTVYDAVDNVGSYLQAYALSRFLAKSNYDARFIRYKPKCLALVGLLKRISPIRSLYWRVRIMFSLLRAWSYLNVISAYKASCCDAIIYGSDEIWNMDNPYFADPFFFGGGFPSVPKLAYATSVGAMKASTLKKNAGIATHISDFRYICVRDEYTKKLLRSRFTVRGIDNESPVCDPTLLIPLEEMEKSDQKFGEPYLLVYTYGVDERIISHLKRFAKEKGLKLVSAFFWHPWADKVRCCSPFEFSHIIRKADFVFTTTFHGAIFTMRNHKRCAILPARDKVRHVATELGAQKHIVSGECSYETFYKTITAPFDSLDFENKLDDWQQRSAETLLTALATYA